MKDQTLALLSQSACHNNVRVLTSTQLIIRTRFATRRRFAALRKAGDNVELELCLRNNGLKLRSIMISQQAIINIIK